MNLIKKNTVSSLLLTAGLLTAGLVNAQETVKVKDGVAAVKPEVQQPAFGVSLYGFVRHEAAFDSRQTVDAREGNLVFWGKDVNFDANHKDINSASKLQMLAVVSRVGVRITAPDVLNAKVGGAIEGDFFGTSDANAFRLRHAYATLDWKKTQLLFGQYWNPLTNLDMMPGVVNFSGGAPYMPFNRNPQIRLTQKLSDKFNLIVAAISQRDLTGSTAPYINSSLPAGHVQLNYKTKNVLIGAAGHYEQIRPALSTTAVPGGVTLASNERLNSATVMVYGRFDTKYTLIRVEAIHSQNAASFAMLGGYVGYTPSTAGLERFSTINTQSYWIEFTGKTKKIVPGFFAGYSHNDGANNTIAGTAKAYGIANVIGGIAAPGNVTSTNPSIRTINYIYRLAPRVEVPLKNLKFGLETEYSAAQWGNSDSKAKAVSNLNLVGQWRVLFATTLKF